MDQASVGKIGIKIADYVEVAGKKAHFFQLLQSN